MNPPVRNTPEEQRPGENPMVDKVSGYRRLTDAELALVNKIKALGSEVESLYDAAVEVASERSKETPENPREYSESLRAAALAKTNFQQGAMWLIRAVAAPKGLF